MAETEIEWGNTDENMEALAALMAFRSTTAFGFDKVPCIVACITLIYD